MWRASLEGAMDRGSLASCSLGWAKKGEELLATIITEILADVTTSLSQLIMTAKCTL